MKKIFTVLIIFLFANCAMADTVVQIPSDFVTKLAKKLLFKTDMSFVEKILVNQVIKNSSIKGFKLKKCDVESLISYFNGDDLFKKAGSNKLIEPYTGITLEFYSDGKCKKDGKCYIIADINGDLGPNEFWQSSDKPNDRLKFGLKKNKKKEIEITIPEF